MAYALNSSEISPEENYWTLNPHMCNWIRILITGSQTCLIPLETLVLFRSFSTIFVHDGFIYGDFKTCRLGHFLVISSIFHAKILENSMPRYNYQERFLRSATEHVFMATPHLVRHCVGSFSIQYSVHYSCLLYTIILYLNIFYKFVL
jgi:hypothetical protein